MSQRYKGAVISATPPTVSATSPNAYGTAKGVWTLQQQMQYEGAGTWPNPFTPVYIEDVFQTWLYTGNGSSQTITNNIDLAGKGGLVWIKNRQTTIGVPIGHILTDTARGATKFLRSQSTSAQETSASSITAFNSSGFSFGSDTNINYSGDTYASWTFRKAEKFFDVVTFTQSGTSGYQTINHNLGSVPGVIIIKGVGQADGWFVYHRSIPTQVTYLNQTNAAANFTLSNSVTSTTFNFNLTDFGFGNGATYVAYLFAHDAGGFGDAGDQNVISCGSFTGGSPATVDLGWEPQWILIKSATNADNWYIFDTMRGWIVDYSGLNYLIANSSGAETTGGTTTGLRNNGFVFNYGSGQTFIYIAIRRGPMKTPETGTSVFETVTRNTTGADATVNAVITPVDLAISDDRNAIDGQGALWFDRLRGATKFLRSAGTNAEITASDTLTSFAVQNGYTLGADAGAYGINSSPAKPVVYWNFRRAPGFFDVVCYDGNSTSGRTVSHNLGVAPELIIVKSRNTATNWGVYCQPLGNTKRLILNLNVADNADSTYWNNTSPTSSVFYVGNSPNVNATTQTYVAYLFATVAGVSKVGSYTGTGALQTVNCGFTTGARFIFIKRTDSTGDWWVYDSARGISSSNDPYLWLNSTNAEVTNTNYVDTTSVGFQLTASAPAGLNANGGTYIFLAIA